MRRFLLSATAVAALFGVAACGDDDDGGGGGATTTAPAGTDAPAGTGGDFPAEATITITELAFPPETRVAAGGTVTVTNETGTSHTVTDSLGTFNEEIAAGESVSFEIAEPGSYEYVCNFHPQMMGVINVG